MLGLVVVLACGGGGSDVSGNHYPLTSSVSVACVNNDAALPVHILIGGEAFNQAANQVPASSTRNRTSPLSYTWDTATDTVTITIFAGRNGTVLDQGDVTLTGDDRMQGKGIRAVWNANQTLTLTKQ